MVKEVRRLLIVGLVPTLLLAGPAAGQESWLTEPERSFFEALGADSVVDGRLHWRKSGFDTLPKIAGRADAELRADIDAVVGALDRMKVKQQEYVELLMAQQAAAVQLGGRLALSGVMMVLGQSPWDAAYDVADSVFQNGHLRNSWQIQTVWFERSLRARADFEAAVRRVAGRTEPRLNRLNPTAQGAMRVEVDRDALVVSGVAGPDGLIDPVVSVTLHKRPVRAQWVVENALYGLLIRAMGVEGMDFEAVYTRGNLVDAVGRWMDRPVTVSQLLPTVPAGKPFKVRIGIDAEAALALESVDVSIWGGEGAFSLSGLPGLEGARRDAARVAERRQRERIKRAKDQMDAKRRRMTNQNLAALFNNYMSQQVRQAQRANADWNRTMRDRFYASSR